MKVLLAAMRSPFLDNDRVYPPLGILYLKSALAQQGIESDVTDDYKTIPDLSVYDAYCASVMTPQRSQAREFVLDVKSKWPNKLAIIGGPHAKNYSTECLMEPWDFVCTEDGERVLPSILKMEWARQNRLAYDRIPPNELIKYPVPDRLGCKDFLAGYNYNINGVRSTTCLSGRGCPMACQFCEDARTAVRWQPHEKFNRELDDIVSLGYGGVYLFDDLFAISPKKVQPYCDALKDRHLIYRCNGHAKFMNERFATLLRVSGCVEIAFGAESGSQKILDNVLKETSVQQNYEFVRMCKDAGITVKAFLMLGLPGEDYGTIEETERFIATSGIDDFQLSIYYPYKGTQIRDAVDRGENLDFVFMGEGLGAYGQKGGLTEVVTRTSVLDSDDLLRERDRLVRTYRPRSHTTNMKDNFFDTHLAEGKE